MDDFEQRVARRAYHLWQSEDCPEGRAEEHWERARFLEGIADNPEAGMLPNPSVPTVQNPSGTAPTHAPAEPLREAVTNLGEFPGRTDPGEKAEAPIDPGRSAPTTRAQRPR